MRILMLSWEYPPRIVGGIARHVEELSWALAARGDEVHVVTCEFQDAPANEVYRGVHVHRVAPLSRADDFVHWVHLLNGAMRVRAEELLAEWTYRGVGLKKEPAESGVLFHAHDWLTHFSAKELKHAYKLPLVCTIHATEYGRNHGIHTDQQRYIASVEWELTYESWRVIVCSSYMRHECEFALNVPWEKMDVIPNGVQADKFDFPFPLEEARAVRARYALPEEKLIVFVGRMVPEKGADLLIKAMPSIRQRIPQAKLLIVGGGNADRLKTLAQERGVAHCVHFTGYVPDDELLRIYRVSDAACFPSLYEPFGIVALEAMAAGTPVVVSDAGGLPDVVENGVSGLVFPRGDVNALASAVSSLLADAEYARRLAENAGRRVRELFNWDSIAAHTQAVYQRIWSEYQRCDW